MITIDVPGEPLSKERARQGKGHTYTPARTVNAETRIATAWLQNRDRCMAYGDVTVTLRFYAATRIRRDIDNLAKLCLDALNGHAYVDDSQVQRLTCIRQYVPEGQAHTTITITEITP
jgi:crossover junction endodeoxyribonuclease RusA